MNRDEFKRLEEMKDIIFKYDLKKGLTPVKVRSILEELGPTFIKLGQILSTRMDMIPEEYCLELSKLRGDTKQLGDEEIRDILKNNYRDMDQVFASIGRCVGSASIAQVHLATLKSGEEVIIKVCRPFVYEMMEADVCLFQKLIHLTHLNHFIKVIDLNAVLKEMLSVAREECNLLTEAKHLAEFTRLNLDEVDVYVPSVYLDFCTKQVLVMEYIDGVKINDVTTLKHQGCDLVSLSYSLSNHYMKQALRDGFFHADPHPDNIFIRDGKIVYLDLGMVGVLSNWDKKLLKDCIKNIMMEDYYEVSRILLLMSDHDKDVDLLKLTDDVRAILSEYANMDLNCIDTAKFISCMFKLLRNHRLKLHSSIQMLIRGIGVIEATLEGINPNLNLVEVIMNYVFEEEMVIDSSKVMDGVKGLVNSSKSFLNLPNEVNLFLKKFNRGDGTFKIEMSASTKQVDKLENMLHEFILGLVDASLILAFNLQDDVASRRVILYFIIVLSILLFVLMIIDRIHRGY